MVNRRLVDLEVGRRVPVEKRPVVWEETIRNYRSAMEHLEFLTRNNQLSALEIVARLRKRLMSPDWSARAENEAEMAKATEILEVDRQFLTKPFAESIGRLIKDSTPYQRSRFQIELSDGLIDRLREYVTHAGKTKRLDEGLEFFRFGLTQLLPDRFPSTSRMTSNFVNSYPIVDQSIWLKLLQELATSKHRLASFYGRFGLLSLDGYRLHRGLYANRDGMQKLIQESGQLLEDMKPLYAKTGHEASRKDPLYKHIEKYKLGMEAKLDPSVLKPFKGADPKWSFDHLGYVRQNPEKGYSWNPAPIAKRTFGKLRFHRKRLTVDGPFSSILQGVLNCGTFDVYWNHRHLYFMREAGRLKKVPDVTFDHLYQSFHMQRRIDVAWDGKNVWLADRRVGLRILSPQGEVVHTVSGLPQHTHGVAIAAIEPGKVLAAGSFGEHYRGWCAIVKYDEASDASVNVFHEARNVVQRRSNGDREIWLDPEWAFRPKYVHRFHHPGPEPLMLIGREVVAEGTGAQLRYYPMVVNLNSLEVSVLPLKTWGQPGANAVFSRNGRLLHAGAAFTTQNGPDSNFRQQPVKLGNDRVKGTTYHGSGQILSYKGAIYLTGSTWHRIDPATWKIERLVPTSLPSRYASRQWGVSAHYGLVGLNVGRPPSSAAVKRLNWKPRPENAPYIEMNQVVIVKQNWKYD